MSLTYGFYNSNAGDRKYDAVQMSSIFDGIIHDGVYASIGDSFAVAATTGRGITVGTGRAWFNHTWTFNDSTIPLTVSAAAAVLDRIDAVVLEVGVSARTNTIKLVNGTPASSPLRPAMVNDANTKQYPLAYIYSKANTSNVTQANITNMVGTSSTPFVTGVMSSFNTDALLMQWGADWDAWKNAEAAEFNTWFNALSVTLASNVAANLEANILAVDAKVTALNTQNGFFAAMDLALPYQNKRRFFRGKSLGTSFTVDQKAKVADGSFTGLWVGDYWTINGVVWRIVDINYWYGIGDTPFNTNHLVIMPDSVLYTAKMYDYNSSNKGYAGSLMYSTGLTDAKNQANAAFPSAIKTHRMKYVSACYDGFPEDAAFYDATLEIPSESMIFGQNYYSAQGPFDPGRTTTSYGTRPLALFDVAGHVGQTNFWLRDSSTKYTYCLSYNNVSHLADASELHGVRPVFAIGG